jgi:hypothetical protein
MELKIHKNTVDLTSPLQVVEFAKTLKQVIVDQRLYETIAGKNYVVVEGWQFCGVSMGILPVIVKLENIGNGEEVKYRAEVELRAVNKDGQVVGSGVAVCSNKEARKRGFDEFAIASMAQTRAIGKAYRSVFGFLVKMAGYEPTPAEEVIEAKTATDIAAEKEKERILKHIANAKNLKSLLLVEELVDSYNLQEEYQAKLQELRKNEKN